MTIREPRPSGSEPIRDPAVEVPAIAPGSGPVPSGADPSTLILNDPLVKRTVELFNARIVHVEPWTKQ
jgi:hypothetical protein